MGVVVLVVVLVRLIVFDMGFEVEVDARLLRSGSVRIEVMMVMPEGVLGSEWPELCFSMDRR